MNAPSAMRLVWKSREMHEPVSSRKVGSPGHLLHSWHCPPPVYHPPSPLPSISVSIYAGISTSADVGDAALPSALEESCSGSTGLSHWHSLTWCIPRGHWQPVVGHRDTWGGPKNSHFHPLHWELGGSIMEVARLKKMGGNGNSPSGFVVDAKDPWGIQIWRWKLSSIFGNVFLSGTNCKAINQHNKKRKRLLKINCSSLEK